MSASQINETQEKLLFDQKISDPDRIADDDTLINIVEDWIAKVNLDNDKKEIANDDRIKHNKDIDSEIEQIDQAIEVIKKYNKELSKSMIRNRRQINENKRKIDQFIDQINILKNSYQQLIPDKVPSKIFISVRYRGERDRPSKPINLWTGRMIKSRNGKRDLMDMEQYLEVDISNPEWRDRIRTAVGYGINGYNVIHKRFMDENEVGDILVHIIAPENLENYDIVAQELKELESGHCVYSTIKDHLTNLVANNSNNNKKNRVLNAAVKYINTLIEKGDGFPVDNPEKAQEIVNKLRVSITVFDVMNVMFGKDTKKYSPKFKNSKSGVFGSFHYVNTRFNHADPISQDAGKILKSGIVGYNGSFINIIEKDVDNILNSVDYFPIRILNGYNEISKIFMNDGKVYRVSRPRNLIFSEIRNKMDLNRFNISTRSKAYQVVKAGTYLAGSIMFGTDMDVSDIEKQIDSNMDSDIDSEDDIIDLDQQIDDILNSNNSSNINSDVAKYDEWDMKNAYINYRSNKYYTGFPVIINEVVSMNYTSDDLLRNTNMNNDSNIKFYEGYYVITNIKISKNNAFIKHIEALNIFNLSIDLLDSDNYLDSRQISFPLMMLRLFAEYGVKFDIIAGAVSVNTEDMKFDDIEYMNEIGLDGEILYKKESEIDENGSESKLYSLFFGQFAYKPHDTKVQYYGSESLAKYLKNMDSSVEFVRDSFGLYNRQGLYNNGSNSGFNGYIYRNIKNTNNKTLSHLFGYISGYCASSVLEQYFQIPFEFIRGIRLDGIYTLSRYSNDIESYIDLNKFKLKPNKCAFKSNRAYFNIKHIDNIDEILSNKIDISDIKNRIIFAKGMGGSGKTHKFINMFNNSVYVAPYHRLISEKKEESENVNYGYTTYGMGVYGKKYCKINPGVIIKDEWTLEPWEMTKKLINDYKDSIIVLCGDFDISIGKHNESVFYYQLPPIENNKISKSDSRSNSKKPDIIPKVHELKCLMDRSTVIEFNKSYRYREDDDIHEISEELRGAIRAWNDEKNNVNPRDLDYKEQISKINGRYVRFVYDFITNYKDKYQWIISKDELLDYYNINDIILASRINCDGNCDMSGTHCKNKGSDSSIKKGSDSSKSVNSGAAIHKCKARVSYFNDLISKKIENGEPDQILYKYVITSNGVKLSDLGINKDSLVYGYKPNNKPYYNGNIIVSNTKIEHRDVELRYAFTINQYQGSTISDDKALYIDLDNLSSINLLYTAISRCKTIDQIFFVRT